jgi:hypothetical protein
LNCLSPDRKKPCLKNYPTEAPRYEFLTGYAAFNAANWEPQTEVNGGYGLEADIGRKR